MRRLAVAMAATALLMSGCGGSDEPTEPTPTKSATPADPDGFTPEQREVADAALAYYSFFDDYQAGDRGDLTTVLTEEEARVVAPLLGKSLRQSKRLGSVVFDPTDVAIDGDTATVTGCRDVSGTATIPADTPDEAVNVPEPSGKGTVVTQPFQRTPDGWRLSSAAASPDQEETPCTTSD